ncbi:hypothetical protein CDAR_424181 [Caerostris darwini]|uniref:Uncharacterized protein n=1 Tax=Caerostris darwini TaxID=1538125 RepID=A0AAV4T3T4_9ARAC|nr:hypothetical protein CDAR_424181 [Caerostris darwini]
MSPPEVILACKRSTDKCPDAANALVGARFTARSQIGSDTPKSFESGEHTARKMGLKSPPFDLSPRLNTSARRTLNIQ